MAGADVVMSNLMVILTKVDEVTELRRLLDKTMKNCKEYRMGNLLTEQITVNYLSNLGSDAKKWLEKFGRLKDEEGFVESEDNEGLVAITRGQKEAQKVIEDVEILLKGEYPQQQGDHEGAQGQCSSKTACFHRTFGNCWLVIKRSRVPQVKSKTTK